MAYAITEKIKKYSTDKLLQDFKTLRRDKDELEARLSRYTFRQVDRNKMHETLAKVGIAISAISDELKARNISDEVLEV